MSTIFEKIIAREIPAHFIYEDDVCIAILDAFPVVDGQTLIIPKQPIDYVFDLDDETYHHLFQIAKKIAPALDATFNTVRTCLVLEGLEVPHVHLKLYPITTPHLKIHGGTKADDGALLHTAKKIREALA